MIGRLRGRLLLLALVGLGCAGAPVGVERMSPREADRRLAANVLATGQPSLWSAHTLHRQKLARVHAKSPELALAAMHQSLGEPGLGTGRLRDRLFALSELAYDHALRHDDRDFFLASAVYAFCFILESDPEVLAASEVVLDSRTRLVANLYNRGLTGAFREGEELVPAPGVRELPFGRLELELVEESLEWGRFRLRDFTPASELAVRGLSNRYRSPGLGAPLSAGVEPGPDATPADIHHVPPQIRVPTTLILRLDGCRGALVEGRLRGRLELFAPDDPKGLELFPGEFVPLETETTASVAEGVARTELWRHVRRSFLRGGLDSVRGDQSRLVMLTPYRPGRVPVVFVHGTNSDPTTWAEMVNEIVNDDELAPYVQPWFFFYQSSNPVAYSGGLLAESLREVVQELDAEGADPALRNMVVIGHSQGGLLTKLTVVDSGLTFWSQFIGQLPSQLKVSPATREVLRRSLIFEPVPGVRRVVFISTPHGGSFLTRNPLSRLVSRLAALPGNLVARTSELIEADPDAVAIRSLDEIPTSIENMTPGDRFLEALRRLPIRSGVPVHSVVAVKGAGPIEEGSDGVVEYRSASLGFGTERVVRSGHSAQQDPEGIAEVRAILRAHLESLGLGASVP